MPPYSINNSTLGAKLVSNFFEQAVAAANFFLISLESCNISPRLSLCVSIIIFSNDVALLIKYKASCMSAKQKPINSTTLRHWCGHVSLRTFISPSIWGSSSPTNCHREEVKVLC